MLLFRMSRFLRFPPTFYIVHLRCVKTVGAVQSMAVSATGFCVHLCPFPAPGRLLPLDSGSQNLYQVPGIK